MPPYLNPPEFRFPIGETPEIAVRHTHLLIGLRRTEMQPFIKPFHRNHEPDGRADLPGERLIIRIGRARSI